MGLNQELIKAARWRSHQKRAFVPPGGGDPSGGGAPPPPGGDPSGGGMPPPPPGGDPMAGGGMPPGDPMAGGGMPPPPPGPPPGDPSGGMGAGAAPGGGLGDVITSAMTNALTQAGLTGKGGVGPNGKPTAPKPDINTIATDVFQLKKMFLHFCRVQGVELPPDILDGPNRDPQTGAPAASPTGGSDVAPGASAQPGQGDPSQAGGQSAIPPIGPMQGAFPGGPPAGGAGGGGMGKTSSVGESYGRRDFSNHAAAVARMFRQRQRA